MGHIPESLSEVMLSPSMMNIIGHLRVNGYLGEELKSLVLTKFTALK